jgi:tetratricopeptide (TPR) repeat protein
MTMTAGASRDPEVERRLEQALDDQKARWGRGERVPVEDFLARDPALRDDPEAILDLVYHEYLIRRDRAERPDPVEYRARFPDLGESLMMLFAADAAIAPTVAAPEDPGPSTGDGDGHVEGIAGLELMEVLGRGGMGVVYRARDRTLDRIVAIKTIPEGRFATDDQRERFRAEAQAVARLRHPNIIAIHAIGEHEKLPYLSLEFAEGGSLADRLAEKPMSPREAAALVETIARAVHAAHQAGVIHRDLKPSNVLLTADGVPKVGDFGLAKLLDDDSGRTMTGEIMGTPSFMSPEQAEGHAKRVTPSTDIYSLGAILYQALTGRPPFLGETRLETIKLVATAEAVPPRRLRPDVPHDLETIGLKCLEKEPARRYARALDLADDLRRFLEGRPIAARPVGPVGRLRRWARRNPGIAALSAAVLASLVVGIGVSTALAVRAIRAEAATRLQRDLAASEAANARAVNEFLLTDLLAQASAHNQARPDNHPDPDLKVRTALDRAAAKIGERFADRPLLESSIRHTIGETYHQLGLFPQALPHLHRALDLRRRLLGAKHPDTLVTMGSLGDVYLSDGKLPEAEPLLVQAMEGLQEVRGPEHPQTLAAINRVANLDFGRERLADAEALFIRLRQVYLRTRGPDDPDTLDATGSLAMVYLEQKKPEIAETLLVEALAETPRKMGVDHPKALLMKANLADVYIARGKLAEAERLLQEVIEAQKRTLGRTHPDTLVSLVRLGYLHEDQNQHEKAEALLTEALEGCRTALDRNHETTLAALARLADLYTRKRDMRRLGEVLVEGAEISRLRWGFDHGSSAMANHAAGAFFLYRREFAAAESYFRDCLRFWVKNHPQERGRSIIELGFGVCLLGQEKVGEAAPRILAAYEGLRPRQPGSRPPRQDDLGRVIERLEELRDEAGQPVSDVALSVLRSDPRLKAMAFDLAFPADPFAPP